MRLLAALLTAAALYAQPAPSRVLIVYQTNAPDKDGDHVCDSLELARYYALKRGVPAANLVGVTPTVATTYLATDYAKFQSEIVGPIKAKLAALGPTNIDVILLAGALPVKVTRAAGQVISLDSALVGLNYWTPAGNNLAGFANPYGANTVARTPSVGADAPRFSHAFQFNGTTMYLVARLGGDDALRGMKQLDGDLQAEAHLPAEAATYGIGYIDSRYAIPLGDPLAGKPYTDAWLAAHVPTTDATFFSFTNADIWIAYAEHFISAAGIPLRWENTAGTISIGDPAAKWSDGTPALTAPSALFYGGWYNYIKYNDVWTWLPGSVACDLNSATTFAKQALVHGASNVSYVVAEPGLPDHQRPNILLYYMLKGYTFAEATALSTPFLGWMNTNDGDPLYAPMAPHAPVSCDLNHDGAVNGGDVSAAVSQAIGGVGNVMDVYREVLAVLSGVCKP